MVGLKESKKHIMRGIGLILLAVCTLTGAEKAWVTQSNENAKLLLELEAKFSPEGASRTGIDGLEEQVSRIGTAVRLESQAAERKALAELERRLVKEKDARVKQDLEIMIQATKDGLKAQEVTEKLMLPYPRVSRIIFGGLRGLLDDQVPAKLRPAAMVRLKKYAGLEKGFTPLTDQARKLVMERLADKTLLGPFRSDVEQDLANSESYLKGIGDLFEKYRLDGYQVSLAEVKKQVAAYDEFIRKEVLPRSREDYRLPPELYRIALDSYGVDIPADQLATKARAAFTNLQKQMNEVAARVAKQRGWTATDYRAVIRELKKDQITGDAILPHYQQRLKQVEEIVRRENIVTLPTREARIRLASPAESAASPAPNMRPPRMIGNTGEMGEFVLPLVVPTKDGKGLASDDFTYGAISWSLTVHELRPGHEMQFAKMIENGVSTARAVFAFNSANVEGWGLYTEAIMLPYLPDEGKLCSLLMRLMRAARAYLDPELQMGKVTYEEARRVLREDCVLSEAMTKQELDRYTFRSPGQATAYYYGYYRLMEIRTELEKRMGSQFDVKRFHDFILEQGLLPPGLLRQALLAEFDPTRKGRSGAAPILGEPR